MNINRCTPFRETVCRAGMIEVNVTQKYVLHVGLIDPKVMQSSQHVIECGFRSGIEQNYAIFRFQSDRGNDAGAAELAGIDDVQLQSELHKTETSRMQRGNPAIAPSGQPQYSVAR